MMNDHQSPEEDGDATHPAVSPQQQPQQQELEQEEPGIVNVDVDVAAEASSPSRKSPNSNQKGRASSSFFASRTFSQHYQLSATEEEEAPRNTAAQSKKSKHHQQQPPWPSAATNQAWYHRVWHAMTYSYMNPILVKGKRQFHTHQRHLVLEDLYQTPDYMKATVLVQQFWHHFRHTKSMYTALYRLAAPDLVPAGIWEFIYVVTRISLPLSLRELLILLEEYPSQSTIQQGGLRYAFFMMLASVVGAVAQNRMTFLSTKAGITLRAALTSAIYEHTLQLSPQHATASSTTSSTSNLSTGEITNLVAIDTQKLYDVMLEFHNAWSCPLLIIVVTALLWWDLGPELTIGVAILLLFLPVVKFIVARMLFLRKERSKLTDVRINTLASMLQGIRVTKLNHYESKVEHAVAIIREQEIQLLKRELRMWGWVLCSAIVSPLLATAAAFTFYALRDESNIITPSKAFSALLLLSILRFPVNMTARLVGKLAQASEGLRRISAYLHRPVRDDDSANYKKHNKSKRQKLNKTQVNQVTSKHKHSHNIAEEDEGSKSMERIAASEVLASTITTDDDVLRPSSSHDKEEEDEVSSSDDGKEDVVLELKNGSFTFKKDLHTLFRDKGKDGSSVGNGNGEQSELGGGALDKSNNVSVHSNLNSTLNEDGAGFSFSLTGLNVRLEEGQILGIVGKVGSGKTLLLNALLGELPASPRTKLRINGTLSYAPQIPFILNQTLRDNILFGSDYHEERYQRVIDACCLRDDLDLIGPARDMTQIGERGVTLSGGQKARVGLARACYAQASVVLLDDVFSALDASTSQAVFNGLFGNDGVLKDCGTILVTHAVHFLPRIHQILVMADGSCSFIGTWNELKQLQGANNSSVTDLDALITSADDNDEDGQDAYKKSKKKKKLTATTADGTIMSVEEREYGVASLRVWLTWFANAGGWPFFLAQVFFLVLDRGFYVASDWWLARWSDSAYEGFTMWGVTFKPQIAGRSAQVDFVTVYALIVFLSAIATAWRSQWSFKGGARCAKTMFYSMTKSVLRAPMLYFETTPLGRILNRFTYDVEVLDVELSVSMTGLMMSFSWLVASIVVMVAVLPWIIFGIIPVATAYFFIQLFYRMSGPDLQRLDAISRSPLQAGLAEGMEGTTSIRAFRKEAKFANVFREQVDKNTSAMLNFLGAQRWLGLRIELLGALIGLSLSVTIVCFNGTLEIAPGLVGLVIQWGVVFSAALNFFFLRLSESEARITSIERVNETTKLDQEAAWETDASVVTLDKAWPARGELEFDAVSMRYRKELPLALDSVSFKLQPGMRCGVIGRTGSGKSSLSAALFRLVEIEAGRIILDGVDLAKIGLSDLRGRPNGLRILPQDPVLYAGTLRDCLDPFHCETDERIWEALKAVHHRGAHDRGLSILNDKVEEGGSNFSVGERQLLCLARAIVEEPRVLVLDEATASVDTGTDAVIQEMLRTRFRNTTLFTVAHRLQTIMDYDVVVVMDKGHCVEFGSPHDLLQREDGIFVSFVEATGPESASELRRIAHDKAEEGTSR